MNRITSTITYENNTPYDQRDEWQRRANPWTAEIRYKRRKMTVPFWTGVMADSPDTWDVAYCLLSDAQCVHWGESFEDFCANLGYDSDSMKAYKTYQQVLKQTESLKRVLGDDFEDFVGLDEDELKGGAAKPFGASALSARRARALAHGLAHMGQVPGGVE